MELRSESVKSVSKFSSLQEVFSSFVVVAGDDLTTREEVDAEVGLSTPNEGTGMPVSDLIVVEALKRFADMKEE